MKDALTLSLETGIASHLELDQVLELAFCPTGKGGGVDPTCGAADKGSTGGGDIDHWRKQAVASAKKISKAEDVIDAIPATAQGLNRWQSIKKLPSSMSYESRHSATFASKSEKDEAQKELVSTLMKAGYKLNERAEGSESDYLENDNAFIEVAPGPGMVSTGKRLFIMHTDKKKLAKAGYQ